MRRKLEAERKEREEKEREIELLHTFYKVWATLVDKGRDKEEIARFFLNFE